MLLLLFCLIPFVYSEIEFDYPEFDIHEATKQLSEPEDVNKTVPELINKYGYPCEEYQVTTKDKYILTLHRIPHGRNEIPRSNAKKVVYLQHGLLSSSADWIIAGPDRSLGYILADEGYDVWMGNARGNKLSREHEVLNNNSTKYWDFSWHEIGTIDVPTFIDFILNKTNQKKLFHIGHSQGTTTFYVMTSELPQYNDKIKAHFSLAPIAFMDHMTSPLMQVIATWPRSLEALFKLIGVNEFLPNSEFIKMLGDKCGSDSLSKFLCQNAIFAVCGFSREEMNATLIPIITGHTPAGSSTKQFLHYAQEIKSGYFRRYDYGTIKNLIKYLSPSPPNYDLNKIKVPIYLYYSQNDWLSAEVDVHKLCQKLGHSCKGKHLVANPKFNHVDYLYGINAKKIVYDEVLSTMRSL